MLRNFYVFCRFQVIFFSKSDAEILFEFLALLVFVECEGEFTLIYCIREDSVCPKKSHKSVVTLLENISGKHFHIILAAAS